MATPATKPLDLAIIGSGPAALTAAIYAARANLSVTVFERDSFGGLTNIISKIENFPGFTGTGADLIKTIRAQAESFGAQLEYGECSALQPATNTEDPASPKDSSSTTGLANTKDPSDPKKLITLTIDGAPVTARAVIVATGSERRKLGIPGEDLPAVSYCATCDGPLTSGKHVLVIGGGNSAVQESFYLLKYAKKVTLLSRSPLRASDLLKDRLQKEPKIDVIIGATPEEFQSTAGKFTGLKYTKDGQSAVLSADSAFVFIGMIPATGFLPSKILSPDGYIQTEPDFSTAIPGLFAAGDCRAGNTKQTIVAAGEGAAAAVAASAYLGHSA